MCRTIKGDVMKKLVLFLMFSALIGFVIARAQVTPQEQLDELTNTIAYDNAAIVEDHQDMDADKSQYDASILVKQNDIDRRTNQIKIAQYSIDEIKSQINAQIAAQIAAANTPPPLDAQGTIPPVNGV